MNTSIKLCGFKHLDDILYVVKDRYGIRPLCIGERDDKIIVSSESCALQDCKMVREVQSGQILKKLQF